MAKGYFTHGMTNTRIYRIYRGIRNRCENKKMTGYEMYGGKGIKCLWKTFEDFYKDMGESYNKHVLEFGEKNTTIDRIDGKDNYCKGNCRWLTHKEQLNNICTNIHMKYKDKKYPSMMALCEDLGINYNTLYKRVFIEGQDAEQAIDEIISKHSKYKYKGVVYKGITDMCKKLNLKRTSISYRLSIGMSVEDAIETPFT